MLSQKTKMFLVGGILTAYGAAGLERGFRAKIQNPAKKTIEKPKIKPMKIQKLTKNYPTYVTVANSGVHLPLDSEEQWEGVWWLYQYPGIWELPNEHKCIWVSPLMELSDSNVQYLKKQKDIKALAKNCDIEDHQTLTSLYFAPVVRVLTKEPETAWQLDDYSTKRSYVGNDKGTVEDRYSRDCRLPLTKTSLGIGLTLMFISPFIFM